MKKEITEQLYLKSNAPLDAKLTPVDNVSDLNNIPRSDRYLGMTIVVLNKGTGEDPCEYWLPKTTINAGWVKKENGGQPIDLKDYYTSAQTDSAISEAVEELRQIVDEDGKIIAQAFALETARTETTYFKAESIANYYTSGETNSQIDSALTNYMTVTGLNEIFSTLEKKPAVVYEHDMGNPIHGQTGNLFTATVWHTLADADLTNYSRLRIYVNPSTHSVDSNTNNNTAAAIFEISLDNSNLTTNVQYYTDGVVVPCLNYDNRLYSIAAMVRNENNAWQIAFKTTSLYGTSSTDITDSYIYKIEGIF